MKKCSRCGKIVEEVRTRVGYNSGEPDWPWISEEQKDCIPCIKEIDHVVGKALAAPTDDAGRGK